MEFIVNVCGRYPRSRRSTAKGFHILIKDRLNLNENCFASSWRDHRCQISLTKWKSPEPSRIRTIRGATRPPHSPPQKQSETGRDGRWLPFLEALLISSRLAMPVPVDKRVLPCFYPLVPAVYPSVVTFCPVFEFPKCPMTLTLLLLLMCSSFANCSDLLKQVSRVHL